MSTYTARSPIFLCPWALAYNPSSSGLLIYAALVDLLAEDFLSESAQHVMTKANKIKAFCWVLAGGELHSSRTQAPCFPTSD